MELEYKSAREKLEGTRLEWQKAKAKVDFQEKTVQRLEQELRELSKEGKCGRRSQSGYQPLGTENSLGRVSG
ncbi:MAG: hypothetical protein ACOX3R_02415 [Desulfitobacteriia bacterium]